MGSFFGIQLSLFHPQVRAICEVILFHRSIFLILYIEVFIVLVLLSIPFSQHYLDSDICYQKYIGYQSSIIDLNLSINLSDFINLISFLVNFGWVSIFSQFILLKITFFLSFSYILFFFLVCARYFVNKYLADCIPCLYGHSGKSNPSTFLRYRNFLKPIFSILIYTIRALATLQK